MTRPATSDAIVVSSRSPRPRIPAYSVRQRLPWSERASACCPTHRATPATLLSPPRQPAPQLAAPLRSAAAPHSCSRCSRHYRRHHHHYLRRRRRSTCRNRHPSSGGACARLPSSPLDVVVKEPNFFFNCQERGEGATRHLRPAPSTGLQDRQVGGVPSPSGSSMSAPERSSSNGSSMIAKYGSPLQKQRTPWGVEALEVVRCSPHCCCFSSRLSYAARRCGCSYMKSASKTDCRVSRSRKR